MGAAPRRAAVIGGGPAGLMAAQTLAEAGFSVDLFEAMPMVGRKFLLAGRGGLNLSNAEPFETFLARYRERSRILESSLRAFDLNALQEWAQALGISLFEGSSSRVFPQGMKASPLLRAWVSDLTARGVQFHLRHRWQGWESSGRLGFLTPTGLYRYQAEGMVLALGGASWPRLGSDGLWSPLLTRQNLEVRPFQPANCGFTRPWSPILRALAGTPVKAIRGWLQDMPEAGTSRGEMVISAAGVEGGLVYALSAPLRDRLQRDGSVTLCIDLAPDRPAEPLKEAWSRTSRRLSLSRRLQRVAGLSPVKTALLRECAPSLDPETLPRWIKALPITLTGTSGLGKAISSAGGVAFENLDKDLMSTVHPGVFLAGEMLDWEAPTGGYLLHACLATGRQAGRALSRWLGETHENA